MITKHQTEFIRSRSFCSRNRTTWIKRQPTSVLSDHEAQMTELDYGESDKEDEMDDTPLTELTTRKFISI